MQRATTEKADPASTKIKKESMLLGKLLRDIAPGIGASVFLEPEWEVVGQITFASGKHSYFRYNTLDLNPVGASDIARDKGYANFFMECLGYPVVPGSMTFYSKKWAEAIGSPDRTIHHAYAYAREIGFPVVVKPNSGSQGVGVAVAHTRHEFYRALRAVFRTDKVALVQKPVSGRDYRVVVLDDRVISAYERIPLGVTGDGASSIRQLLEAKQERFMEEGRGTVIKLDDPRMKAKLARQGLGFDSVLKAGESRFVLDNANLSTGGDSVDVTGMVHPGFRDLAVKLTKDMNLRLCGVDLMVAGSIGDAPVPGGHWILEINAAPGLDHYARAGEEQERIVEGLYLEVLKALDRR